MLANQESRWVEVEVISPVLPTIESLGQVSEFLGWLADLYDAGTLDLIACDNELKENFAKIRAVYPAVLSAVQVKPP